MIDIDYAKKAFDRYTSKYDMSNEKVYLKYHHTYRVCEQSICICNSINLNEEDTKLAYLIALLHDIGRFEQIKRYETFNDIKSIDHAEFGCKLLFEEGLIREFIIDESYDEIINKAIYNHNKNTISDDLNERELLHSKIIRDADKLDIIYNVATLGQIVLNDDDKEISKEVVEIFNSEKTIDYKYKKTKNDAVITMLAFVYDHNFDYSYRYYKDNDFINKMFSKLKYKNIFKEYVDKLNEYIERKCNNVRN